MKQKCCKFELKKLKKKKHFQASRLVLLWKGSLAASQTQTAAYINNVKIETPNQQKLDLRMKMYFQS